MSHIFYKKPFDTIKEPLFCDITHFVFLIEIFNSPYIQQTPSSCNIGDTKMISNSIWVQKTSETCLSIWKEQNNNITLTTIMMILVGPCTYKKWIQLTGNNFRWRHGLCNAQGSFTLHLHLPMMVLLDSPHCFLLSHMSPLYFDK